MARESHTQRATSAPDGDDQKTKVKTIAIHATPELHRIFKARAVYEDRHMEDIGRDLIIEYLRSRGVSLPEEISA